MRLRLLPLGLLLAACAFAATSPVVPAKPAPWKPKAAAKRAPVGLPATTATGKPISMYINGVPDTGQFLPDTVWLARVNTRVTTVADFIREYFASYPEYRPNQDSLGRVAFLTTMINHDVMGLTARAIDRPFDFEDRITLREYEQRTLSDAFYTTFVLDSVHVTDEQVEAAVQQMGLEGHFRHILFDERPTAERVRKDLVAGKIKWHDAVAKYSRSAHDPGPDGDMGWAVRNKMQLALALPLFGTTVGGYSQVFLTEQGYEIAQLVETRMPSRISLESMRRPMRKNLFDYYCSLRADSIQAMLRDRIGMVFDTANVVAISSRFKRATKVSRAGYTTNIEVSGEVPDFSDADTSLALATWKNGGRYSVGEFLAWYTHLNVLVRPNVDFPDGLMGQINGTVLEPYRAELAKELGLDRDPYVVKTIAGKAEQMMVERMYGDSVSSKIWVSREERQAYYEKHKLDFVTYAQLDYAAIIRHTKPSADSLLQALQGGADPRAILAADSVRGEKTGTMQHRREDDHGKYHKILFEELRPGKGTILGPDEEGIYAILFLTKYDPGTQLSFADAQGMIDESMQNLKSEERLKGMLERFRKRYDIAWRPELVMQVRLVEKRDN